MISELCSPQDTRCLHLNWNLPHVPLGEHFCKFSKENSAKGSLAPSCVVRKVRDFSFSHLSLHRKSFKNDWAISVLCRKTEQSMRIGVRGWPVLGGSATTPSPNPTTTPNWSDPQMEWLPGYLEKEMKIYINTQNMKFCTCHALALTTALSSPHLPNGVLKMDLLPNHFCCNLFIFFHIPELKISMHQCRHWYSSIHNFCLI